MPAAQDRNEPSDALTGGPGGHRTPDRPAPYPHRPRPQLRPRGRAARLDADGYDPHEAFGWPRPRRGGYALVPQMFVLNALPDPWARIRALQDAAAFAWPRRARRGRSPEEITKPAAGGSWAAHHDGYSSSEGKGSFQRGISAVETLALARRAGLFPMTGSASLPLPG
ncbi:hypothetical protein ACGFSI_12265 [Streptomyces virginiae]|uniref:hypothetical protein n=1 Tax=Streptomyces virginiae TaxID=1961 RepID=UPI0037222B88